MKKNIFVLSTKKLKTNQRQFLLNAGFSVLDADFIQITSVPFHLKTIPSLLLFTSQNAVKSVMKNPDVLQLKGIPAICVGTKTRKLLEENGFKVVHSEEYAHELVPSLTVVGRDKHIAFFAGNLRRNVLPDAMHKAGISFDEYRVYENQEKPMAIKASVDALLFFSPSGIKSFLKKNAIAQQVCFCIGTTTADTLNGITRNIVIAGHQTVENVIIQCINYYKNNIHSSQL